MSCSLSVQAGIQAQAAFLVLKVQGCKAWSFLNDESSGKTAVQTPYSEMASNKEKQYVKMRNARCSQRLDIYVLLSLFFTIATVKIA